jgi:tight adherence protein B
MMASLALLKLGAASSTTLAAFSLTWSIATHREGLSYRAWSSYVGYLDRSLRNMFLPTRGQLVAGLQLASTVLCAALAMALRESVLLFGAALGAALPPVVVARLRRQRLQAIEGQIEGFLMTLANALKATPSIASALAYTQPLLTAPIEQELELALKEMRVGSSLDQALLNMAARVRSEKLDAALASLLIGRQVGGNLPQILETTAATLREMSRLLGVVRSKTAEGKSQLFVLALFPAALVFLFDWIRPNYFAPLTESFVGALLGMAALGLWASSIVLARKVLMVDL